jgi:hypothetical protein
MGKLLFRLARDAVHRPYIRISEPPGKVRQKSAAPVSASV